MDPGATSTTILMLNNDCLFSIFSYLDVTELMVVESVCQRFKEIAEMSYKTYRKLDFRELTGGGSWMIPLAEAEDIARRVGPHVHILKIAADSVYMDTDFLPIPLLMHFKNLQFIYLDNFDLMHVSCIDGLKNLFPDIKYIVLDFCRIDDGIATWFVNSPKLEVLKFINIDLISGEFLTKLRGIKELKLYNCPEFESKYFQQFCEENPQLRKLSLYLDILQEDNRIFFQSIARNLKNLESLVLWDVCDMFDTFDTSGPNFEILDNLPKITRLRLHYTGHEDSDKLDLFLDNISKQNHIECLNIGCGHYDVQKGTLEQIGKFMELKVLKLNYIPNCDFTLARLSCSETLQELHLIGCEVTPRGLEQLIEKFQSLRLINLSQCSNFNINFLIDIESCLGNRTQVLEFIVNQTPIEKDLKEMPKSDVPEFLDLFTANRQSVKLTINANNDGSPKRYFHEWEEWEGDLPDDPKPFRSALSRYYVR